MCETMFSSQTRQNVHISTPLPPALFRENTTVVSRTAKMELFFPVLKVIQDCLFVCFFMLQTVFFLFQRVFFSECRNSLFRDRRTRFELRDVERRFEGRRTRGCVYRRYQTFRRLAPRDERTISCPFELLGDT